MSANDSTQGTSSMVPSASMFHSRVHVEIGDISRDNMTAITVTPGESFHNKFGRYSHDDIVGQKFGSKMHSPPPHSGYLHLLRPTPELWTLSLPHRTQILYLPDISYITMRLGVRVGGKVIEAGTGSGSMTHSMSRTVGPRGQVFSFEYHRPRYEAALGEFETHGLTNVTLQHRNVCKDGFEGANDVEGVFLDLPAPWEAIPHVVQTLRQDIITRICSFSPCLEQVLKTVSTLRSEGFSDVSTQEVLIRTHELAPPPATSTSHLGSVTAIVDRLKGHEKRKEERRMIQMKTAREKARKVKVTAEEEVALDISAEAGSKRKLEGEVAAVDSSHTAQEESLVSSEQKPSITNGSSPWWSEPPVTFDNVVLTKPSAEMKGHTSYLTFAILYPQSVREGIAAQESHRPLRVAQLAGATLRAGSQDTEYGSDGLDEVMGTLTEEEMVALAGQ
ncbi:hypothetical protein IAR55_002090 [Kwoniella newhampshirensis]|uniref:tRNA (adenine(58)-N(1))-methyltransferase catalytic subunit TRM61 n=1 Tax=Kwoniella newhampshirensis TaxID=1651941 RepID=A0AAW0YYK3_9TREE